MRYRKIIAALTAALLLLSGCVSKPREQERPAEEVQQTEAAEVTPLSEGPLTDRVRMEPFALPDYFQAYTLRQDKDGFVYITYINDEGHYVVHCDENLQETSKAMLTAFAPYDGYYEYSNWTAIGEDAIYGLVIMQNHNDMNPADAPEEYDQAWWDKYYESSTSEYFLCTYALDGTMASKVKVEGLHDYEDQYGDVNFNSVYVIDGKVYLYLWNGTMLQVGMDGSLTETMEANQEAGSMLGAAIIEDRDGKPMYWKLENVEDPSGMYTEQFTFSEFDAETGTVGKTIFSGTTQNNNYNLLTFPGGFGEYRFFAEDGYKLTGIKDDGSTETVIDWTASDLNPMGVYPLPDGTFLALNSEIQGESPYYRLTRLHSSEIEEKQVLRIGVPGGEDYPIRDFVQAFNRSSQDWRVETVAFDADDFKTAMHSEDAPDLLFLWDGHQEFLKLGSKGVFADLNTFLASDPEVNQTTVLANVRTALQHPNGALYAMPPTFNVDTLAVKEKFHAPENWTMDDMLALYDGADEMQYYWSTQEETLRMLLIGTDFTDEMAGTCNFDSPEFVKMLEFCSRYPEKSTCPEKNYENDAQMEQFEKWYSDKFMSYQNDQDYLRPLLLGANTGFAASAYAYAKSELGGAFTMAGYPSDNKQGGKIKANCEMGILSTSKHQDAAWAFLRRFVLEYEDQDENAGYSVLEQKFEEQLDDEMYIMDWEPNGGRFRSDEDYYDDDTRVYPLTQEERDGLETYIRGLTTYMMLDEHVENIVMEEAGKYFGGDCSAEEAAKAIQSRAQLMLSEQSG